MSAKLTLSASAMDILDVGIPRPDDPIIKSPAVSPGPQGIPRSNDFV